MNKIVLAQIDTIAGDVENNAQKIIGCIKKAEQENADLIIFPELVLMGYPFGDTVIRHKSIVERQIEALLKITKETNKITALVGYIKPDSTDCAKPFYSSIAVIQNGEILYNVSKENSQVFEINGEKYGVIIGDDINYKSTFDKIEKVSNIIHCSCSPSRLGKEYNKNNLFSSVAKKYAVNYIYVNKVGYADNLSFDGTSRIYNKTGRLILRAKCFDEDFVITSDLNGVINEIPQGMEKKVNFENFEQNYEPDLGRTYKSIVFAIKEYFRKNGFKKAVLGLSGGLDSSVCAVLLTEALGRENVCGISMPSKITSKESKTDAEILAKNLGIHFLEIPLAGAIEAMQGMFNFAFEKIKAEKSEKSTTIENLQARIRATILWSISNEYKGMLPIATSDKSEAYIGYATVNGDMSGGFAPIADVTKTKLFALADFLNKNLTQKNVIPQNVLEKPPGAELKINSKTGKTVCAEEDNMPYEFLDEIIWLVENKNIGKTQLLKHSFLYERKNKISYEQKEEWINKFYWKSKNAVYKWHIMPPSVIIDIKSINSVEYHQPIISKIY